MNYCDLKEIRRHGDDLMPVAAYEINPQNSLGDLPCHWHREWELWKLERGHMKIRCGDQYFLARQGNVFFLNSGEIHAAETECGGDVVYRAVVFDPELLCGNDVIRAKYIQPVIQGRMHIPSQIDDSGEMFEALYALLTEKKFGYELSVKALLLKIVGNLLQKGELRPLPAMGNTAAESVKRAIGFLQENYQRTVTTEELALLCNMSQGHFCRLFKQYTMKTPVQYMNNVRISKAVELLISGDRKILDIAMDTGFNGLSYFIGVFKNSVGSTPTKFRREYGQTQNKNK